MDDWRFGERTWTEVRDLDDGWVAVLPVGAVEAHGPHLPLRTDGVIAEAMAREGARELRERGVYALVLPTLDYSAAPFAEGFPGTISVGAEAVAEMVASIAVGVDEAGGAGLVLASAHLDPAHIDSLDAAVELAAAGGARIVFPDVTRRPWALRLTEEFRSGACHAGRYESSIVMAEAPESVREDLRAELEANLCSLSDAIRNGLGTFEAAGGPDAYFGDPAAASVEEGTESVRILGSIVADAWEQALEEQDEPVPEASVPGVPDLKGRGAVVTGGGRGIGAVVARALAEAGAHVVVGARSTDEIEAVAEQIRRAGGRALAVPCDVTDPDSVENFLREARAAVPTVDILVNNAGIGHSAPVHRETLEDWNRVMAVNATGVFLFMRAVLGGMLDRDWGRVINIASVAGLDGERYIGSYAASKHAVVGLTRSAAAETEGKGVTVNAVCPGYVDTPMTDRTVADVMERSGKSREDALATVLAHAGQPRLVSPEEVAEVVLDLCSEWAADANGETILLDGND